MKEIIEDWRIIILKHMATIITLVKDNIKGKMRYKELILSLEDLYKSLQYDIQEHPIKIHNKENIKKE
jgi:hypothetical protein